MNEENEKSSQWESLIGDLGVEIQPEALERKQPAPKELPKVVQERGEVSPPPVAPSDWSGLASSLGLEVPLEPEPAPEKAEPVAKKPSEPQRSEKPREPKAREEKPRDAKPREGRPRDERRRSEKKDSEERGEKKTDRSRGRGDRRREKPVEIQEDIIFEEIEEELVSETDIVESSSLMETDPDKPRITGEAARSAFDALFSADAVNWGSAFVSPRTNVESSFLFTEGEEAVFAEDIPEQGEAEEDDAEEPKKRLRRRRRGGRGRGRGRRGESSEKSENESEIEEGSVVEDDEAGEVDETEIDREDGEEGEERPEKRRRRPRGRGRRRSGEESSSDEDDSHVRRRIAAHVEHEEEDEDEDEDEGGEEARGGHRNLPTWNDAIGVIVEGNLAQRSKAPAKSQNSSSRGRSRGGRRHKKS